MEWVSIWPASIKVQAIIREMNYRQSDPRSAKVDIVLSWRKWNFLRFEIIFSAINNASNKLNIHAEAGHYRTGMQLVRPSVLPRCE